MNVDINAAIANLREERQAEAEEAVAVRIQSLVRARHARKRTKALREEFLQRFRDMTIAATKLQSKHRGNIGRQRAANFRRMRDEKNALLAKSATIIQKRMRGVLGRRKARRRKQEVEDLKRLRIEKAIILQSTWRGTLGRRDYAIRKREHDIQTKAAIKLQKIYRGSKVPGWRHIRFDRIRSAVLARKEEDAQNAKAKMQQYLKDRKDRNNQDSASEEEEEEDPDDDWQKMWDETNEVWVWYSPSKNQTIESVDRPDTKWFEKSLVNKYVKIFWPMENQWFPGYFSRFNKIKMRHRVNYDDGDHEWINIKEEQNRIQIYNSESNTWVMLKMWPRTKPSVLKATVEAVVEDDSKCAWEERWDEINERVRTIYIESIAYVVSLTLLLTTISPFHHIFQAWYFNKKTRESADSKPPELQAFEEKKQKVMQRKFEELTLSPEELFAVRLKDWVEYFDEEYYKPYWYNMETGETSWIDPASLNPYIGTVEAAGGEKTV